MPTAGSDPFRSKPWRPDQLEEKPDLFDRLPDSILLVIFNRIGDVKALGRCCVVSRRFQSMVPFVDNVVVRVDCVIYDDPSPSSASGSGGSVKGICVFSCFDDPVLGGITKPLQALGQIRNKRSQDSSLPSSSLSSSMVSHHSPIEVLKNFNVIRKLKIELPASEVRVDDGVLLKWKADFGSTLNSFVILGASSSCLLSRSQNPNPCCSSDNSSSSELCGGDDSGSIPESLYMNKCISLFAAGVMHYLVQPIINDHETLESLDLSDADGQGVLTMDDSQLKELRANPVSASQRTLLPALSLKRWYAPYLEIPGGFVLKGVTLDAFRQSEEKLSDRECWVSNAFEEPYGTAARMLVKRRPHSEMNF